MKISLKSLQLGYGERYRFYQKNFFLLTKRSKHSSIALTTLETLADTLIYFAWKCTFEISAQICRGARLWAGLALYRMVCLHLEKVKKETIIRGHFSRQILVDHFTFLQSHFEMMVCILTADRTCGPDEWTCKSKSRQCIPVSWVCDDHNDCDDSSDEDVCSKYLTEIYVGGIILHTVDGLIVPDVHRWWISSISSNHSTSP